MLRLLPIAQGAVLFVFAATLAHAGAPATPEHAGATEIVFLGTGAADSAKPRTHSCANCRYVRENGGKNERRHASLFVPPGILIDYSTTGRDGLKAAGIPSAAIDYILVTHSHGDHCDPQAIAELAREKGGQIVVFGDQEAVGSIRKHLATLSEPRALVLRTLRPYEEFAAGGWQCRALPANHTPQEEALLYVLRGNGKSLFYATDTAWFPNGTFYALKAEKLDLAIVEATFGEVETPDELSDCLTVHLNLPLARLLKRILFKQKIIKPGGRFAVTHLSLHWCEPHDLLEPKLAAEEIVLPYDGMRLRL